MPDHTENDVTAAWRSLNNPNPRHGLTRRPANPHLPDEWQPPDMSDYITDPDPHHHGQHRGDSVNLTAGILALVVTLLIAGGLFGLFWFLLSVWGH